MSINWPKVIKIVNEALDQPTDKRQAYAEQACGNDAALREAVLSLLSDDSVPVGFLAPPIEGAAVHLAAGSADRAAAIEHMGRYRVTEVIDSGGAGTVYRAVPSDDENAPPVAVKVLKRGMAGDDMQRRFQQEQEVLARLKHRHIARFIDGGVTSAGLLYLVMEFIEGRPIDRFCDQQKLAVSDRLELFEDVCSAVQYSHRNLVVHRDLKPRNILVTNDGVPKLLDFGIAKLLEDGSSGPAPDPTVTANRMITPQYASPEQIRGAPISTATDVYSLGVVLYELLTGHRPYDLRGKARGEILDLIGEADPTNPSTQVMQTEEVTYLDGSTTTLTPELVSVARGTDPQGLRRELTGDLDTIVLTAMHKDPDRRYASVERLAEDLRRYRTGLPILAHADTFSYRARKFIRRNKAATIAAAIAFISLIAGTTGLAVGLKQAQAAQTQLSEEAATARREASKAEQINGFLQEILIAADPHKSGKDVTIREVLREAASRVESGLSNEPHVQAAAYQTLGQTFSTLGEYEEAKRHMQAALELYETSASGEALARGECLHNLGALLRRMGELDPAVEHLELAIQVFRGELGSRHPKVATGLHNLALVSIARRDYQEAEDLLRDSLQTRQELLGNGHEDVATSLDKLALVVMRRGRFDEAEGLFHEALAIRRRVFGSEHLTVAASLNGEAQLWEARGDYDQAETLYREALKIHRNLLDNDHPRVLTNLHNLGVVQRQTANYKSASSMLREALAGQIRRLGNDHLEVAKTQDALGMVFVEQGLHASAKPLFREALRIRRERLPEDHISIVDSLNNLAGLLLKDGEHDEAASIFRQVVNSDRKRHGENHPSLATSLNNLAVALEAKGLLKQALASYEECLQIRRAYFGNIHPLVGRVLVNLAGIQHDMNDLSAAEASLREALLIYRDRLPADHPALAHTLYKVSTVLMDGDDPEGAEPFLRESLEIVAQRFPQSHIAVISTQRLLGHCLALLDRHDEAEQLLLAAYSQAGTLTDSKTAVLLSRLVSLYESWDKPEKAAEYRALLEEATGGDESDVEDDSETDVEAPASDAKTDTAQDGGQAPASLPSAEDGADESP